MLTFLCDERYVPYLSLLDFRSLLTSANFILLVFLSIFPEKHSFLVVVTDEIYKSNDIVLIFLCFTLALIFLCYLFLSWEI